MFENLKKVYVLNSHAIELRIISLYKHYAQIEFVIRPIIS